MNEIILNAERRPSNVERDLRRSQSSPVEVKGGYILSTGSCILQDTAKPSIRALFRCFENELPRKDCNAMHVGSLMAARP